MRCDHLDEIAFDRYFLQNNMWGKEGSTGFEQCIEHGSVAALPFGWHWTWPDDGGDRVRAYPFVGFGQDPWRPTSTSPDLPRLAAELGALTVRYDARIEATGEYNFAIDVWITSAPGVTSPPENNITRELMVWLDYSENPLPPAWLVGEVSVAGVTYDYYRGVGERTGAYVRDYLAFLRKPTHTSGSVPLHEFVRYLVEQGHVLDDEYVRNVFLGNEIWHGTGQTSFASYAVSVE